ncbi:AAA family ATPase [Streptomyces sp. NPDC090073]|uniref:AAA family ATPase n=1 Tax=Streptomyces sp. NPDC090073 TaxID=3365936 RepID=UPI00382B8619
MQTIDPRHLPTSFTISQARAADLGEHPRLLDGFLYQGLTVLYSEPGLGKSMLAAAVEEHLAYGRPFGRWTPERAYRCLVVDFEGDMRLASERSLTNTPWGLLPSDHGRPLQADIEYVTEVTAHGFFERLAWLEQRLEFGAQQGQPYAYIRIDTMRLFLGAKPHGVNAYEWDAACLGRMNRLALHYGVALVLVHHTNKAGEVSGSTGVAGSAVVVAQLKRNPDNDDECLLMSHKVRVDAPFRYPVVMDDRGRWEFTEDITPTQADLSGTKRAVVDLLTARGPKPMADIREALDGYSPHALKTALRRLRDEYIVIYRHGMWQFTQQAIQEHPKCLACGEPMEVYERGQTMHPTCSPDPAEQATAAKWLGLPTIPSPAPAPEPPAVLEEPREHAEHQEQHNDEDETEEHPEAQRWPALMELQASVARSRMKPVKVIPKVERESTPWTIAVAESLDGHFRSRSWTGELPEGTEWVVLFDRNGSYMSAMSSVPVAPNRLTHTGALGKDRDARANFAGLFQILNFEWTDPRIPHPLGRTVEKVAPGEPVWINSSQMDFLDQWSRKKDTAGNFIVPVADVVDSYTGRRNTSLFEKFYEWSRIVREQTSGEERVEAKRAMSRAVRSLHPKKARSPFWRPDWHKSVLGQSAIRHWIKAYQAVHAPADAATLLSIGATDEVAFAVPAGQDPTLWLPPGYKFGAGYGEVKHKELLVQGENVPCPVTVEQWLARGRGSRRGE